MHRRFALSVIVGAALILPRLALAQVPARGEPGYPGDPLGANPPVRQTIGMMDTLIRIETKEDCLICHTDSDEPSVKDRHHLLADGRPIPLGSAVPTAFRDSDGDGEPDPFYTCLSCHGYEGQFSNGSFALVRDCIVCHSTNPHHTGPDVAGWHCKSCHGDIVDDPDDGHYIPDYPASLVTPNSKDGEGAPLKNLEGEEVGAGGCNYCHDDDGRFAGDPYATPPLPDERVILRNADLHHGAVPGSIIWSRCTSCHNLEEDTRLRKCQDCHGPDSLHNIQADSENPDNLGTIVIGGEQSGYGHVGRDSWLDLDGDGDVDADDVGADGKPVKDSDCWGCHGFAAAGVLALAPRPIAPTIYSIDRRSIRAGNATAVVISGVGFINRVGGVTFKPVVSLTAADGSTVTLAPDAVSQNTVAVTIPGDIAPGNYTVRAVKDDTSSNSAVIAVVPAVTIATATAQGPLVTITGGGFALFGEGLGTSVTGEVVSQRQTATILSWTDTKIVADFGDVSPQTVTVKSVFGTASSAVENGDESENGGRETTFSSAGGVPGKSDDHAGFYDNGFGSGNRD